MNNIPFNGKLTTSDVRSYQSGHLHGAHGSGVYIGRDRSLQGKRALVRLSWSYRKGMHYTVQVNDLEHPHAHGWHPYELKEWVLDNPRKPQLRRRSKK